MKGTYLRSEKYEEVRKGLMLVKKGVISNLKLKNKWDHQRGIWKEWKQLIKRETRLGCDPDTRKIDATDKWQKIKLKVSLLQRMLTTAFFYNYEIVP